MTTFADWVTALTSSQVGRIFWANYQYDVTRQNLDSRIDDDFQSSLAATLSGALTPTELIDTVIREGPERFDQKCSRQPKTPEPYSRVLEVTDFALYNLSLAELGLEVDDALGSRVWDRLGTTITPYYYTGHMKTLRNFFWGLPTRRLTGNQGPATLTQDATAIRNQLGLYHIAKDRRLLRIDIPATALAGRLICAPTTLDAGINVVFAPCADATGVGWTMNLETLRNSVEELIIASLIFDSSYTVTKIGIVTEAPPDLDLDMLEANALARQ